jgi:hypothetical protein
MISFHGWISSIQENCERKPLGYDNEKCSNCSPAGTRVDRPSGSNLLVWLMGGSRILHSSFVQPVLSVASRVHTGRFIRFKDAGFGWLGLDPEQSGGWRR